MNRKTYFVTATDTECGKTFFSSALVSYLSKQGKAAGFKPIAAGCDLIDGQFKNEDALALQQASNVELEYSTVNPIALEPAIAPHIAAAEAGVEITFESLTQAYANFDQQHLDYLVVEGAGGWKLPLGNNNYLSDWVAEQELSVILVVGLKLGCLNHALLTQESIKATGCKIVGWVANSLHGEMPYMQQNIETLQQAIDAPLLGVLPKLNKPSESLHFLNLSNLL
ncbi:dethiobiotin synthase [Catenovulum agarivorans DS-2]|uniref:ATP-dependent dethiobiotin synthetase BioD n=1 Tax=Catenovulum agarivorans DS-2 TaxID=1328313 RepID=W7Q763_9ALTE|nr:dethiobiotin synthase [Catenovulum agarivorans]EWH08599.1 dethiobiotin synthase [Catenovulum agarivorans DS-2]